MKQTAAERYYSDAQYKQIVDALTGMMVNAQFTPSEIREAAIMASINFENMRVRQYQIQMTPELHAELEKFNGIVTGATS